MALPVFLPLPMSRDATLWTILSWGSAPLHGLSRVPRHRHLCRQHLSWGSSSLQRIRRRESTSVRSPFANRFSGRLPTPSSATPVLPEHSASRSHPASYGVAHRFSQPRSDFFLSPPSRHFQTGGVRGIHPTGGCSSYEASAARRRRNTLVTFLPRIALPPS